MDEYHSQFEWISRHEEFVSRTGSEHAMVFDTDFLLPLCFCQKSTRTDISFFRSLSVAEVILELLKKRESVGTEVF